MRLLLVSAPHALAVAQAQPQRHVHIQDAAAMPLDAPRPTGSAGKCKPVGTWGKPDPHARLEAIPFARFTVECQQQLEKENRGRRRWDTSPQFMDSAEAFADEEEESSEDDDKKKEKD